MQAKNLSQAIRSARDVGGCLPQDIQSELCGLLSGRCRADTRNRLARRIALPLSLWPNYGIFSRVHFDETGVSYCAGQSYPDEIRTVRELILKG